MAPFFFFSCFHFILFIFFFNNFFPSFIFPPFRIGEKIFALIFLADFHFKKGATIGKSRQNSVKIAPFWSVMLHFRLTATISDSGAREKRVHFVAWLFFKFISYEIFSACFFFFFFNISENLFEIEVNLESER